MEFLLWARFGVLALLCLSAAWAEELVVLPSQVVPVAGEGANWESEERSAAAQEFVRELLAGERELEEGSLIDRLRPLEMVSFFQGKQLEVFRGKSSVRVSARESISSLNLGFRGKRPEKFFLKTDRVVMKGEDIFETNIIYQAGGQGAHGTVQQNGRWAFVWKRDDEIELMDARLISFEEIVPLKEGGVSFEDRTASVFAGDPAFETQLMRGVDYWRPRLMAEFDLDVNGMQGLSLADVNGDGLEDLYLCQQGGLPNKLYLRQADGSLRDYSAESGLDWMEVTRAALFVDLDNDGDRDLALSQGWFFVLLENDGSGKFRKRAELRAEANLHSISAADYDLDGDLDLYFCGRNPLREKDGAGGVLGQPVPYHDANNGGSGILLRNEGAWRFVDVTKASGMDVNNRRYSYACSWEDFDDDGDPDLYVANDFGRNNLYRNDGGTFVDVAGELGVEDLSAGMGITWGDFNNDGRPDAYVSNMFSSAGNRIAYQRRFREGAADGESFQRHARGNSLFANQESGFKDVSLEAGVTMARWAWGAQFADLNNDGWEDLYVGNGFVTTENSGDL